MHDQDVRWRAPPVGGGQRQGAAPRHAGAPGQPPACGESRRSAEAVSPHPGRLLTAIASLCRVAINSLEVTMSGLRIGIAGLSLVYRQIVADWQEIYRISPLLRATFVEQPRFTRTACKAAGWIHLRTAQGHGRRDTRVQGTCSKTSGSGSPERTGSGSSSAEHQPPTARQRTVTSGHVRIPLAMTHRNSGFAVSSILNSGGQLPVGVCGRCDAPCTGLGLSGPVSHHMEQPRVAWLHDQDLHVPFATILLAKARCLPGEFRNPPLPRRILEAHGRLRRRRGRPAPGRCLALRRRRQGRADRPPSRTEPAGGTPHGDTSHPVDAAGFGRSRSPDIAFGPRQCSQTGRQFKKAGKDSARSIGIIQLHLGNEPRGLPNPSTIPVRV